MANMTPSEALFALIEGNRRWVAGQAQRKHQDAARRGQIKDAQEPIAAVLGCADSRVPPEIIFDQGLGDLFVVRVAGNVVDDYVLASLEYATDHLHVPIIVVLGHGGCGAVGAAVQGEEGHGHMAGLLGAIAQATQQQSRSLTGDPLDDAIRAVIKRSVAQIRSSEPILRELVDSGRIDVVGGYYDMATGTVDIIT